MANSARDNSNTISLWANIAGKETGKLKKPPFLNDGDRYFTGLLYTADGTKYPIKLFTPKSPDSKYDYSGRLQVKIDDAWVTLAWIKLYRDSSDDSAQTHYGFISADAEYEEDEEVVLTFTLRISITRNTARTPNSSQPNFIGRLSPNFKKLRDLGYEVEGDTATPSNVSDADLGDLSEW